MPATDPQLTPRLCMVGLIVVFVATMAGAAYNHDNTQNVMVVAGLGGTLATNLFGILQSFAHAKKQEEKAEEVKQAVVVSDTQKDQKLNHISETVRTVAEKVETVAGVVVAVEKNTNGALTDKLKNIADDVKTTIKQNEAILDAAPKGNQS